MKTIDTIRALLVVASVATADAASASELRGSPGSMRNQYEVARSEDYTFLRTSAQVREYAEVGRLDTVPGNANYRVNKVSFPYARPEVLSFIERLAHEYRAATGEQLVVTSLTRPTALQPRNAHKLSVHPAGMAVDLRIPFKPSQREWLEAKLLSFENGGVLDVTRETRPPHYHVAVFPGEFREWAAANPIPLDRDAAAKVVAHLARMMNYPVGGVTPLAGMNAADVGAGITGWALAALAGIVFAGGFAGRRLIPAVSSERRTC